MGVYINIKGMEMPRNCYNCWLGLKCPKYEALLWNEINKERKADCPLVPVPPHGRLIDADELVNELVHSEFFSMSDYNNFVGLVLKAPTIIPAEPLNEEVNE